MRRIEVKNFIVLKEAIYEPKKFNVIIGPQATGKSLLVKLEYFFNKVIDELLVGYIIFNLYKSKDIDKDINNIIKENLYKYFDKETLSLHNFDLIYKYKDIKISIRQRNNKLSVYTNKDFKNIIENSINEYNKTKKKYKLYDNSKLSIDLDYIKKISNKVDAYLFIPAGRTYFSTLSDSIYKVLSNNVDIDHFLLEFGAYYEGIKRELHFNNNKIEKKINKIIKGIIKYSELKNSLGIENENNFIKLSLLSSGQQEIIPLLVVLFEVISSNRNFIIEEPEAHLYPTSQKELIELIAYVYNQGSSISITTHSPYIITEINNLLLLDEKKDKISKDNPLFEKLDYKISSKDLSAYTIEDGVLKNIYDKENNLIDAYTIDSVSEELSQEFDELLEL